MAFNLFPLSLISTRPFSLMEFAYFLSILEKAGENPFFDHLEGEPEAGDPDKDRICGGKLNLFLLF